MPRIQRHKLLAPGGGLVASHGLPVMAGDWIKIEHATPEKPEVHEIASILNIDANAVVGACIRLWIWADQQCVNGNALRVTFVTLDRISQCAGLCAAMRSVGWLDGEDMAIVLPHFDRHNGETAKTRALNAKRVAKHRGRCNANSVTNVTVSPLPEKRREEGNQTDRRAYEKTRADLMAAWQRWTGQDSTTADAMLFRWLDGLGAHDPVLVEQCISHAIQTRGKADTLSGAVKYVAAVYERCKANACKPGDFGANNGTTENRSRIRAKPGKFAGLAHVCRVGQGVSQADEPHPEPA